MRIIKIVAPAAAAVFVSWAAGASAFAAPQPHYPPTSAPTTQVLGTQVSRVPTTPQSNQLPFTGEPIALYSATGAGLVVAGGLLTVIVRRRGNRRSAAAAD